MGIVESGGRWHVHWAVGRGEIGEDFPVTAAKGVLLCWRALAGLVGANHGITLDPIFDLARVLRLPGTSTPSTDPRARSSLTTCRESRLRCPGCAGPCTSTYLRQPHRGRGCGDGRDGLRGCAG